MDTTPPPLEPGARRALRARLRGGPVARAIACGDVALFRGVRQGARPPLSEPVGRFSRPGEHAALWLVLNSAIKAVVRRRRPALEELPALVATPTAPSVPSAHASSSLAAARAYAGLVPAAPLYATATAMAVSRVYLGAHDPTDIAAGALLGTLVGSAAR